MDLFLLFPFAGWSVQVQMTGSGQWLGHYMKYNVVHSPRPHYSRLPLLPILPEIQSIPLSFSLKNVYFSEGAHCSISLTLCLPGSLTLLWNRNILLSLQTSQSPELQITLFWPKDLLFFSLLKSSSSVSSLMWGYIHFCAPGAHIFQSGHALLFLQHVSLNIHGMVQFLLVTYLFYFGGGINTQLFLWPRYRAIFTSPLLIRTSYFQKAIWLKCRHSPQSRIQALFSAHTPQERARILSSPGLRLCPSVTDIGLQGLETRKGLALCSSWG